MIGLTKIDARHERFGALIQALDMAEREFKTTFEPRPPGPKKALFTAYRKVRPAVEFETQGKCAYCESYVKDTYVGDVEHILPKDGDPKNRTLRYSNLTFVRWLCNNHKSNCEFDDGFGLLNPYDVDPQSYLRFFGTMLRAVPNENRLRGQRTIDKIGLNRPGGGCWNNEINTRRPARCWSSPITMPRRPRFATLRCKLYWKRWKITKSIRSSRGHISLRPG